MSNCQQYSQREMWNIVESGVVMKTMIMRLKEESIGLRTNISRSRQRRKTSPQEMMLVYTQNDEFEKIVRDFCKRIEGIERKLDTIILQDIYAKKSEKPNHYAISEMNLFWEKEKKANFLIKEITLFLQKMKEFCKKENIEVNFNEIENKIDIKNRVGKFAKSPVGLVWANVNKIQADLLLFHNSILKKYLILCEAKEGNNPRKNNAQIKVFITEQKKKWKVGETYKAEILLYDYVYPKIKKVEINNEIAKIENNVIKYKFKPSKIGKQFIEGKIYLELLQFERNSNKSYSVKDSVFEFKREIEVLYK